MKSKLLLIIRREYLERVYRKSFIITTLLTPLLMAAIMAAPAAIMLMTGPESKTIAVVDESGVVAPALNGTGELQFVNVDNAVTVDSVRNMTDYDGILFIGQDVVDNPNHVSLYARGAASMQTEQYITNLIEKAVESERIKRYDIANLEQIIADLNVNVSMSTYRLDKEEAEETSSIVSYLIGVVLMMLLYMFILLYGNMVMNSIIEEKNNRVLEIIVSSVKPQLIMLGKIIGIGLVALTQLLIWALLIGSFSKWIMPLMMNSMSGVDPEMLGVVSQFTNTGFIMQLFLYITLFLIGGFVFYASIFAAIGSAVDNVQDASQLSTIAVMPIMLGMIVSMVAVADPNSSVAFWTSLIPFTSPMVMMTRIPFGIPTWEIWLSLAVLFASFMVMVWLAAKIYRVGIFMYGKKPTFKDLIRWTRYK